jgi:hypothetical protein
MSTDSPICLIRQEQHDRMDAVSALVCSSSERMSQCTYCSWLKIMDLCTSKKAAFRIEKQHNILYDLQVLYPRSFLVGLSSNDS